MYLHCPFCGPRERREFSFHKTVPGSSGGPYERTYERTNRQEVSVEHWQHGKGCRMWLVIVRNPSTGEVLEVSRLGGACG